MATDDQGSNPEADYDVENLDLNEPEQQVGECEEGFYWMAKAPYITVERTARRQHEVDVEYRFYSDAARAHLVKTLCRTLPEGKP